MAELGTEEYSRLLAEQYAGLSPEAVLAGGFDTAGLAREHMPTISGEGYTPQQVNQLADYYNLEGVDINPYGFGATEYTPEGTDQAFYQPIYGDRGGSYGYQDGEFGQLDYLEKQNGIMSGLTEVFDPIGSALHEQIPELGLDSLNPLTQATGVGEMLYHQSIAPFSGSFDDFLRENFEANREFTQAHPGTLMTADAVRDAGFDPMQYLDEIATTAGSLFGGSLGPIGGAIAGGAAGWGLGSQFAESDEPWQDVYEAALKGAGTGAVAGYASDLGSEFGTEGMPSYGSEGQTMGDIAYLRGVDASFSGGNVGGWAEASQYVSPDLLSQAGEYAQRRAVDEAIGAGQDFLTNAISPQGQPTGNALQQAYAPAENRQSLPFQYFDASQYMV